MEHDVQIRQAVHDVASVAAASPGGTAVLVEVGAEHATQFVDQLSAALVHAGTVAAADVRSVAPTGERWKVDEITADVCAIPSQLPRGDMWLIAVHTAAAMDERGFTRLLRTVEEPLSPTLWVFLVEPGDELPPALRGRLADTVTLPRSDPHAVLLATAEAAGVSDELRAALAYLPERQDPLEAAQKFTDSVRPCAEKMRPRPPGVWMRAAARAWFTQLSNKVRHHLADAGDTGLAAAARFADVERDAMVALSRYSPAEPFVAAALCAWWDYNDSLSRQRATASAT